LPDEAIRRAIAGGVVKINFNTELRIAYVTALAGAMPEAVLDQDIVRLMQHAKGAVRAVVETKQVLLGAAGRA
jgi:fructose-bisphosphate aldolase, class II